MKGIDIIAGFNVKSDTLIDDRMCKKTLFEMNSIKNVTDGQPCFCLEDETLYIYYNQKWNDYKAGSQSSAFTYSFDFTLAGGEGKTENDYLTRI